MKSDVRIALLSVDHEDIEGYTGALKSVFEQHVVAIDSFNWGNRPAEGTPRFRHHEDEELTLHVPDTAAVAVSMFMEQVMNVITGRPNNDRESRKTFTLAVYEVVPSGKSGVAIGRVKLIDQTVFQTGAVGRGMMAHPEASPQYELNRMREIEEEGKATYSYLNVRGRGLLANEKTRAFLATHSGGSVTKIVKPVTPAAK